MRKPLKLLALVLALLLPLCAMADPLTVEWISGTAVYPENAPEDAASFVYRYLYPLVSGDADSEEMINGVYSYLIEDAMDFAVPMTGEEMERCGLRKVTAITSEITCNNDKYFCVKVTTVSVEDDIVSTVLAGHTFSRRLGVKTGTVTSLPYLLGILKADEGDTWLQDRQTAKADECIRQLVWEQLQDGISKGKPYYTDIPYEDFSWYFYPEEDFYMDENGDPVFFIQEGVMAPVEEGVLLFPITMEELLDEI